MHRVAFEHFWSPWPAWRATPIFGKNQSSLFKKISLSIESCWGVAGPRPFFGKNWSCLKRQVKLYIISKFLLYRVAYGLKNIIFVYTCWVTLRGVAGPRPFIEKGKIENCLIKSGYLKIPFVSINLWPLKVFQACWVSLRGVTGPHFWLNFSFKFKILFVWSSLLNIMTLF